MFVKHSMLYYNFNSIENKGNASTPDPDRELDFPPFGFDTTEMSSNSIENRQNAPTPDSDRECLISSHRVRYTGDEL